VQEYTSANRASAIAALERGVDMILNPGSPPAKESDCTFICHDSGDVDPSMVGLGFD
jgi:hypothetical protein